MPTVVGEVEAVEITMLSNHANYSRTYTPGPVPVPDFNVMFHDCLTLLGEGPWEIDTEIILNKQPDSYWAAYKLHDTWYAEEMVGGHARLNVPAGTFAANNEIELLIGYGKNPTVPVELSSFTATINAENYVLLTWVSQSESNISGYNVYRNTSDDSVSHQDQRPDPRTNSLKLPPTPTGSTRAERNLLLLAAKRNLTAQ